MKPNEEKTPYEKARTRYGFLASLPILLSILHLIASLVLMSYIKLNADGEGFNHVFCLGETFGVAMLTSQLVSLKLDAAVIGSASAVVAVVLALVLIFLSSAAVKGNKKCFFVAFLLYAFDTLVMVVTFFLNFISFPLGMEIYDYILGTIIHLVGLALFAYGLVLSKRLDEEEYQQSLQANSVHISKGRKKQ